MTEIALTTDAIHRRGLNRRNGESLRNIVAIDARLAAVEVELKQLAAEVMSLRRELGQGQKDLIREQEVA